MHSSDPNPYRDKGDARKHWHRRLQMAQEQQQQEPKQQEQQQPEEAKEEEKEKEEGETGVHQFLDERE